MHRLNGFYFEAPSTLKECKLGLIKFLDDADDDMLMKIMEDKMTVDEEIMLLIGKAVVKDIISFKVAPDQVSMKVGTEWKNVKMISTQIAYEERMRLFAEFLTSQEGGVLLKDIQNRVEPKTVKKVKPEEV